jgi:hypothetical protein
MTHPILFTGHMIDSDDRTDARFPADKEEIVSDAIYEQLQLIKRDEKGILIGIASGACGGDILFHERCKELGIETEMYLAAPIEEFRKQSVSFGGVDWEARFDTLVNTITVHILPKEKKTNKADNIWALTNHWMLDTAFMKGESNFTLLALWDGKGGDGDGGTEHMIEVSKKKEAKINIININKI